MKLHISKFRGERLKAVRALTMLYFMQVAGYMLYVSVPSLYPIPSQCFGCPPPKVMQCTWTALLGRHTLTFRYEVNGQRNIIDLCRDFDVFSVDNPQDVFYI